MNSCIINIEQLLSYKVVTASFRKHQKKFSKSQLNGQVPNLKLQQLEMQYASKKLNIDYEKLFKKEARHVAQNIADYKQNHPDNFTVYLLENYKNIMQLFNSNPLVEMCPLNLLDNQIKENYLHNEMQNIKDQLQNEFVVPILNFIETNYPQILLERNVLLDSLKKLLCEINKDQLHLKRLPANDGDRSQYAVYSTLNSCFYYMEYNSFNDLLSYRQHLNTVYSQFVQYLEKLNQIITDPIELIMLYNKIKSNINEVLDQFEIIPEQRKLPYAPLPNYIRKDTLAHLKKLINDSFIPGQDINFNPCLGDFQDLQYCIGKKAMLHVESIIKLMQFAPQINGRSKTPLSSKSTEPANTDKIKTELTVNQISFFLRCMFEEKGILAEPNKIALCRKIASVLSSTSRENLSAISINNKLLVYDDKTVEFCIEKFTHFLQFAKKVREKNNPGNMK